MFLFVKLLNCDFEHSFYSIYLFEAVETDYLNILYISKILFKVQENHLLDFILVFFFSSPCLISVLGI